MVAMMESVTFHRGALADEIREQRSSAGEARSSSASLVSRQRNLGVMGTDLVLEAVGSDAAQLDRALDAAIAELRRVEDLMTDWRDSPLTELNHAAGAGWVEVDRELTELIQRALALGRLTEGAFDISYAGAGQLWDFKTEISALPAPLQITQALANVGWARVRVDATRSRVQLPAGMKLGLGGIAKGYGVDRAMAVLMQHGVEHAMVNAGGDMKLLGRRFGEPWEVAIKHPRDRELAIAALRLSNVSVVTSGDYERFFELDGRRYHHIIDPRTGYPATGAMAATVIAPQAELADALATALCVMQPEPALALIEDMPRTEAILVGLDGVIHASSGLAKSVRP
ncbi:MAG: FAD:protein FMN transferase [Deltaproteobacteria bacterium]|nr:FAD:protein FMN transferase [Deltaproteobacteria bacterium]